MVNLLSKIQKIQVFPMVGGVTCSFLSVDNFIKFLFGVAFTISGIFRYLQIVKLNFTNKAFGVVANLLKPLNPSFYTWVFLFPLITC